MPQRLDRNDFLWVSGSTCLDFSNTRSFRHTPEPLDRLETYDHLLDWAGFANLITTRQQRELRAEAASHPRVANTTLSKAREIREVIYRIFASLCSNQRVRSGDLEELNRTVMEALLHRRLVQRRTHLQWEWNNTGSLGRVLWPVVNSAAELLASEQMRWVRECSLESCSALFVDSSKNKKRRWCDMRDCGNLVKARKHRARERSQRSAH